MLRRRDEQGPSTRLHDGSPGPQACLCSRGFHQRGIAMLGSDTHNDLTPSGYPNLPCRCTSVGIVAMGLWLNRQLQSGRAGASLCGPPTLGVFIDHRAVAAAERDRIPSESARHFLTRGHNTLTTAQASREITMPPSILILADEVIK